MGSPNFTEDRPGLPIALVVHTMGGTLAGTDSWFRNTRSQVSAHYGVGLDGAMHLYVLPEDTAWANGIREPGNRWDGAGLPNANPNGYTVSIETEDRGDPKQAVTDAQYAAVLAIGRRVCHQFPSIRYLLRHADISPRTRPGCPGDRWVKSGAFQSLANTLRLKTL